MSRKSRNKGEVRRYRITIRSVNCNGTVTNYCRDIAGHLERFCQNLLSKHELGFDQYHECLFHGTMTPKDANRLCEAFRGIDNTRGPRIVCMQNAVY